MSSPDAQPTDTPLNHGPVVGVMTWFLLAATVCAVIARVLTKLAISRRFSTDDFLIFAALALSIGQAATVTLQTSNGLGKHAETLSTSQLEKFYKFDYASNLLFILNLCFAKISVLQMLRTITPVKLHVRMVLGVGILPSTWKTVFWNSYAAFNLATEAALLVLPLIIVWKIKTQRKKKAVIFLCFASRIVVLAAITVQLIYHNRPAHTSDMTFKTWPTVLSAQMVQSLSIITACIPSLKPFLESLESGMLRSDDLRRRGIGGVYGYGSHNLTHLSTSRSNGKKEKVNLASNPSAGKQYKLPGNISTVVSVNRNEDPERDSDSQKSSARIIKYTRTFSVE
ncbi:MAG: hypothetical protein Q9224_003251 [Gallowayella concinna]